MKINMYEVSVILKILKDINYDYGFWVNYTTPPMRGHEQWPGTSILIKRSCQKFKEHIIFRTSKIAYFVSFMRLVLIQLQYSTLCVVFHLKSILISPLNFRGKIGL